MSEAKGFQFKPRDKSEATTKTVSANQFFAGLSEAEKYLEYIDPIVAVYNKIIGTAFGIVIRTYKVGREFELEITRIDDEVRIQTIRQQAAFRMEEKLVAFDTVVRTFHQAELHFEDTYKDSRIAITAAKLANRQLFFETMQILGYRFIIDDNGMPVGLQLPTSTQPQ